MANSGEIRIPVFHESMRQTREDKIGSLHLITANFGSSSDHSTASRGVELEEEHDECPLNDVIKRMVIKPMDEKLKEISSLHSSYDIYTVPPQLHELNPKAYTPESVSIGPLHHKKENLESMEIHKLRYLRCLLNPGHYERKNNCPLIPRQGKSLQDYFQAVSNLEQKARRCYSETICFTKDEFLKTMVVDGCFLLNFFQILLLRENDHLASNDLWACQIKCDLIKLENQLPFFVLEKLHDIVFEPLPDSFSFSHLTSYCLLNLFASGLQGPKLSNPRDLMSIPVPKGGAKHLVDLLRSALIPASLIKMEKHTGKPKRLSHCASELRNTGVEFQSSSLQTSLFDIRFEKGVLTIPTLSILDSTETVLRNIIAYEQGLDRTDRHFTAYAAFMDGLIDSVKDVRLLERGGIIENHLGSPEAVVDLFNNITKHVINGNPIFADTITELEKHSKKPWNRSKEILMRDYFNTPWALISFAAAVFLLILTVVQTVCSILQF